MKLSFWTLGMPPCSNTEFVDKAAELGYEGIDIRCTNGGNISSERSQAEVADPRCTLGCSPDHCYEEGEDPIEIAERYAPVITQLHIADRKRTDDGHYEACWIGDGIEPHGRIIETLARRGFDGWVSLKWERGGGQSRMPMGDALLPHYVEYMKSLGVPERV